MLSKTVVLLSFVYFVGANIVVNIFDDDVHTVRSSVRSCNLRWCEQQCRNKGFTGGVCVGDRCKCDINNNGDADMVPPSVSSCVMQWCDQKCRNMGFPGGVCYRDICKCDINKIIDIATILPTSMSFCNKSLCDQQCRRKGYLRGRCIANRCECYIFRAQEDELVNETPVEYEVEKSP